MLSDYAVRAIEGLQRRMSSASSTAAHSQPDAESIWQAAAGLIAAAARAETPTTWTWEDIQQVEISAVPFSASFEECVAVTGAHPMLGLMLQEEDASLLCLKDIARGTPSARLPRWQSWLWHGYLREVTGKSVRSIGDVKDAVRAAQDGSAMLVLLTFTNCEVPPRLTSAGIPQLSMDQLNMVRHHLAGTKQDTAGSSCSVGPRAWATVHRAWIALDQL